MGLLSWLSDLTEEATNDDKDAPAEQEGGLLSSIGKMLGYDDANEVLKPGGTSYDDQKKALQPFSMAKTTSRLNMRQTPGTSGEKMLTLDKGEEVQIIAAADWANVIARGEYGWCHTDYLEAVAGGGTPSAADDVDPAGGGNSEVDEPSGGGGGGGGGTPDGPTPQFTPDDFDKQTYQVGDKKEYTVASAKGKTAKETPATYTAAVLQEAGLDAKSWYAGFTTTTFLGRQTAQPIHSELAAHLKNAEGKIVGAHKQDGETVKKLGERLGMGNLVGSRKEPTGAALSMHLMGLAIDIAPGSHRYLKTSKGKKAKYSVREVSNWVFGRAGQLLRGAPVSYNGSEDYDEQSGYDELLEEYFALLDLDDAALEAKLQGAGGDWAGMDAAKAREQINTDLDTLAQAWHGMDKWEKNRDRIKEEGLMNFSRELVEGLGLHWGAQYGDMMHFDMRNTGVGKKVHGAIKQYKKDKTNELKNGG